MARLKCPNCANIIEAAPGTTPTCPACGFRGAAMAAPKPAPGTPFSPVEDPVRMQTTRPGWTTTAVVLQFISGGFAAIAGIFLLIGGGAIARFVPSVGGDIAGAVLAFIGIFLLIFAVLYLLLASQVAKGRNWARITTIVLSSISAFFNLFGLMGGNFMAIFSIAFDALIIVGLCMPDSRAWFAQQEANRGMPRPATA